MAEDTGDQRRVIFAVAFYFVTSITLVMANKWVLNAVEIPITFLWFQIVIAVILLHVSALAGLLVLPTLEKERCRALLPLITVNVVGLSFNTLCLKYVDAAFFQVARSLVLPMTVGFTWVMLHKPSSPRILAACGVVVLGFLTGVSGEIHLSVRGVAYGLLSSLTTALHAVVIKSSLKVVGDNTMDLVYYNNVLSMIMLAPMCVLSGELSDTLALFDSARSEHLHTLMMGSAVTGFFGFLINIAGFLQIKVTSPVTHMISSAARGVVQTAIAVALFGDVLTAGRVMGILLILVGSSFYTWTRNQEAKAEEAGSKV